MFNRFPDPDFLFDLQYIRVSIFKALLRGDGQQYANARPTRRSMFAMKPEMEIWPCSGSFRLVGESTYLSMVSEKIVRIS